MFLRRTQAPSPHDRVVDNCMNFIAMTELIPDMRGPKLAAFRGNLENIEFLKLLGPDERDRSLGDVPHGRVFLARMDGIRYAIKIVSQGKTQDRVLLF